MSQPMDAGELSAYLRAHFTHSAYRWERQPVYEVAASRSPPGSGCGRGWST